ncbi:hypothetical protein IQ07DRAFT_591574 [Pyrenochaeta sp. DS3sAY3a]|nr:hypothetical protein IQ07DRAFT_591574 [Pyrenochaeta sp. DS3sAY3a]
MEVYQDSGFHPALPRSNAALTSHKSIVGLFFLPLCTNHIFTLLLTPTKRASRCRPDSAQHSPTPQLHPLCLAKIV